MAAPAAAAAIQIHFFDLPVFCRAGGVYAVRIDGVEGRVGLWIAWAMGVLGGVLVVTITGRFGNGFGALCALCSDGGASCAAAPKAAGSSPANISDATTKTIVADMHLDFDFISVSFLSTDFNVAT
jgi:hypothetical protein